jgi:hypothetical protein
MVRRPVINTAYAAAVTPKEKHLYHQIHPAKLLTDWCAGVIALYLLWRHDLTTALVVMLIPPPVASWLVMRSANLEPYRQSPFGRYVARYMTHAMEAVRLAGMVVMALGAWSRSLSIIVLGAAVVLFGWLRGVLTSKTTDRP